MEGKKIKTTRDEVRETLVTDKFFFEKGIRSKQILLTISSWILVIIPFVWVSIPIYFLKTARRIHFKTYFEERLAFDFLLHFFIASILFFVICFVLLTIQNNRKIKNILFKKIQHDTTSLSVRKKQMECFYSERYGNKKFRHDTKYYVVKPCHNIDAMEIDILYLKNGVKL